MNKDTLILGAFEPEVELLRDSFQVDLVGIGAVEAAVNTTRILSSGNYREVLFVGSVGSLDQELPLLETFVSATDVAYLDYASALGVGKVPELQAKQHRASIAKPIKDEKVLHETVVTTPSLSYDDKVVEAVYRNEGVNARFENLELFGVASACIALGVSWGSFCCLTNYLGPNGHEQWKGNYIEAAKRTAQLLKL